MLEVVGSCGVLSPLDVHFYINLVIFLIDHLFDSTYQLCGENERRGRALKANSPSPLFVCCCHDYHYVTNYSLFGVTIDYYEAHLRLLYHKYSISTSRIKKKLG